jgi:hypothetical protein
MTIKELIEELKKFDENLPAYDWDNEEISYIMLRPKQILNFSDLQAKDYNVEFPERIEIG